MLLDVAAMFTFFKKSCGVKAQQTPSRVVHRGIARFLGINKPDRQRRSSSFQESKKCAYYVTFDLEQSLDAR